MATLYHFDIPVELERLGGWANKDTVDHFRRYADICFKTFGPKVCISGLFLIDRLIVV